MYAPLKRTRSVNYLESAIHSGPAFRTMYPNSLNGAFQEDSQGLPEDDHGFLLSGEALPLLMDAEHDTDTEMDPLGRKPAEKLGMFSGVYVPCVLSIFGVVLFLRLGWAVGNIGLLQVLGLMAAASMVDFLTILSTSALATNGRIRGGGPYYLLSRALGPAFGGASGVMFFLANALGATFYLQGFAETAISAFDLNYLSCYGMEFVVGGSVLMVTLLIALVGARFYSKTASMILAVKMAAICLGFLAFLVQRKAVVGGFEGYAHDTKGNMFKLEGFTGISKKTFLNNLYPNPGLFANFLGKSARCGAAESVDHASGASERIYTTAEVFGVIFPAFTGILAGANMSGDLKTPGTAIASGSVLGVATALMIYIGLTLAQAATVEQPLLLMDSNIMQDVCWWPGIIVIGIFCSTFASALSSIVGGARILQAIARDDIFGFFKPFARGSGPNDEPRLALLMTCAVVAAGLLIGNLNTIAPILSQCFLMIYAQLNFAVLLLGASHTPNFRPTFRYFSASTAFFGTLASIGTMLALDYRSALTVLSVTLVCFSYLAVTVPTKNWGNLSQALLYHQVLKYLLMLDFRKQHVKYWRPQILFLNMGAEPSAGQQVPLLKFANLLKQGGVCILGDTLIVSAGREDAEEKQQRYHALQTLRTKWHSVLDGLSIQAFVNLVTSPCLPDGANAHLQLAGLGAMTPNTVMLDWSHERIECLHVVVDAICLKRNILALCNFEEPDEHAEQMALSNRMNIDVWLVDHTENLAAVGQHAQLSPVSSSNSAGSAGSTGSTSSTSSTVDPYARDCSLLLQYASIYRSNPSIRAKTRLRVCGLVNRSADKSDKLAELRQRLFDNRINAQEAVVYSYEEFGLLTAIEERSLLVCFNTLVSQISTRPQTRMVFLALPSPPTTPAHYAYYLQQTGKLTHGLPPTALVYASEMVTSIDV